MAADLKVPLSTPGLPPVYNILDICVSLNKTSDGVVKPGHKGCVEEEVL